MGCFFMVVLPGRSPLFPFRATQPEGTHSPPPCKRDAHMRPDARKLRAHGNDTPLVATCPDSHSEVTMEGVNPVGLNLIFDITNETPVPGGRQLLSSRMRQRGCPFVSPGGRDGGVGRGPGTKRRVGVGVKRERREVARPIASQRRDADHGGIVAAGPHGRHGHAHAALVKSLAVRLAQPPTQKSETPVCSTAVTALATCTSMTAASNEAARSGRSMGRPARFSPSM